MPGVYQGLTVIGIISYYKYIKHFTHNTILKEKAKHSLKRNVIENTGRGEERRPYGRKLNSYYINGREMKVISIFCRAVCTVMFYII